MTHSDAAPRVKLWTVPDWAAQEMSGALLADKLPEVPLCCGKSTEVMLLLPLRDIMAVQQSKQAEC